MRCEQARQNFKALLDGELSPVQSGRVRRHIARCADCAKECQSLQSLNALLLSADIYPAGDAVRLPMVPAHSPIAPRLVFGACVMALLVVLLLVLPTWDRSPQNLSAAVAAAIKDANTWHLSGWKQINGKRVSWDVWGRRRPFLYYEKIGNDTTIDDGAQRLRIFPANPALNRPQGLVICAETERQEALTAFLEPSAETMVGQWNWSRGGGMYAQKPFRQTATTASFRRQSGGPQQGINENQIYTISKRTWLPEQYQLHFQSRTKQWDTESLVAQYDVPLPRDVISPTLPPDYRTVDLTQPANADVSVQAKAVAMDAQGNILMRYRTRLAGVLLTPASTFSVSVSSDNHESDLYGLQKGVKATYLHTTLFETGHPNNQGDAYELYSPLKPIHHGDSFPKQLRVTLDVTPTLQVKDTDFQPENGPCSPSTATEPLFRKQITQTVSLPKSPNTTSIAHTMPKELDWVFRRDSLQVQVDMARFDHYYQSADYQNVVYKRVAPELIKRGILNEDGSIPSNRPMDYTALTKVHNLHRKEFKQAQQHQKLTAVVWLKRMIAARPNTGEGRWTRLSNVLFLAEVYNEAGQPERMKQTLRQLIQECQSLPQHGGLPRRQAEYALRTGQFPGDADYKGPS